MTKLILIRHGQTNWNLKKRYCGFMDIGLNPRGKKQAVCLHKRMKQEVIHKVYSSDRKRAIQTAQIAFKTKDFAKIPDLREMHFGVFEGLTYKQIMKKYPLVYKEWLNDPFAVVIPQGESLFDFRKRVIESFEEIIYLNYNKTAVVVCHGGTISIFINSILRKKDFWKYIPDSASISIIEYKNKRPAVKLLNDTAHYLPKAQ